MILGFHPNPLSLRYWGFTPIPTKKLFGKSFLEFQKLWEMDLRFVWVFRFGARNFSIEKFLWFYRLKKWNQASFFEPSKPPPRLFPLRGKKPAPKTESTNKACTHLFKVFGNFGAPN